MIIFIEVRAYDNLDRIGKWAFD